MLPRILHGTDGTQVVARGETSAVASQNHAADRRGGGFYAFDMRQQLFEDFGVQAVEFFWLVEAERRQTITLAEDHLVGTHVVGTHVSYWLESEPFTLTSPCGSCASSKA